MTAFTAADAHAAVARGAEWLDRECPDWASKIDLDELDMRETNLCILGQTAECIVGPAHPGDIYFDAGYWRVVNVKAAGERDRDKWTQGFGFDVPDLSFPSSYGPRLDRELAARYEMLTLAWSQLVRERLAVPA